MKTRAKSYDSGLGHLISALKYDLVPTVTILDC